MGTIFFLLCLLFLLVRADLGLKIRVFFRTAGIQEYFDKHQKKLGRMIFSTVQSLTGFRITVEPFRGPPLPRTVLLVSNHQSLADIPVLVYSFPPLSLRFVTKRELGRGIPAVSPFLRIGGSALISRKGNFARVMRELAKLARLSADGPSPVVFPEGTRSRTGRLGTFQAGAFRVLCEQAPLPVFVVAMDGGWRISRMSGVFTKLGRTSYRVKPLALYPAPRGKKEIMDLLGKARSDIDTQLRAWRKEKKTHPYGDGSER